MPCHPIPANSPYLIHESVCNPGLDPTPSIWTLHTFHWPLTTPVPVPTHFPPTSACATEPCCTAFTIPLEACWTNPRPPPLLWCHLGRGHEWCTVWLYEYGCKTEGERGNVLVQSQTHQLQHCLDDIVPASQPTVECNKQCKCGMPLYQVCVRCLPWKSEEKN